MSQQNVEIVQAMGDAWNAGDMDTFRELLDPGVIVCAPDGWPEPGPFVGREEVMRQWERNREAWEADEFEAISVIDAGDRVVARLIWRGVGRGPASQLEFTAVYTIRKGRLSYQESFWDHAEALETLGLSQQPEPRTNPEIVREAWEAFMRRDNEAALALYDPEVELHHPVDGDIYRGLGGVSKFFRDWLGTWTEISNDLEDLIDAGDDVIAVMHVRARGRQSEVPVERRECHVWSLRNGKLWRLRIYATKAEALEAVGRSE